MSVTDTKVCNGCGTPFSAHPTCDGAPVIFSTQDHGDGAVEPLMDPCGEWISAEAWAAEMRRLRENDRTLAEIQAKRTDLLGGRLDALIAQVAEYGGIQNYRLDHEDLVDRDGNVVRRATAEEIESAAAVRFLKKMRFAIGFKPEPERREL